jgi:hypothetical protein
MKTCLELMYGSGWVFLLFAAISGALSGALGALYFLINSRKQALRYDMATETLHPKTLEERIGREVLEQYAERVFSWRRHEREAVEKFERLSALSFVLAAILGVATLILLTIIGLELMLITAGFFVGFSVGGIGTRGLWLLGESDTIQIRPSSADVFSEDAVTT